MPSEVRSPLSPHFRRYDAEQIGEALKVLAEPSRLQIINLLAEHGRMKVGDLIERLDRLAQPSVSYHLKMLAAVGLVRRERQGSFNYCELNRGELARLAGLLGTGGAS